jgi:hypothetical protein
MCGKSSYSDGGVYTGCQKSSSDSVKSMLSVKNEFIAKLREEYGILNVPDEMINYAVGFVDESGITDTQMTKSLEKGNLVKRSKNVYLRDSDCCCCKTLSPRCEDEFQDGFAIEKLEVGTALPEVTEFNIKGPAGRVNGLFTGDGSIEYGYTEELVRWLSAYIKASNLASVTLFRDNQEHLTNLCDGQPVVVVDRGTKDLKESLPLLINAGVTILAVTQIYSRGLVYTDDECYYCDGNGNVHGYNRIRGEFYDISDPFIGDGTYCKKDEDKVKRSYMVFTFVKHGNQRVVVFAPGELDYTAKYVPEKTNYYLQTPEMKIKEVPLHKHHIGKYAWKKQKPGTGQAWTFDPNVGVKNAFKPNMWQRLRAFLAEPLRYKRELLTMGFTGLGLALCATSPAGAAMAIGAPSIYAGYRYINGKLNEKIITLAISPVVFKCEDEKLRASLANYYAANPIGSDSLAYGFYNVTPYSITQLPEGYPGINYTNMFEFYKRYSLSKQRSSTAWVGVMNASMENCGFNTLKEDGYLNCFTEMHDTIPTILSSKVPFKVKIMDKDVVRVCLSNKEDLRKYLMTKFTEETLAAITSRRVTRGGWEALLERDEIVKAFMEAWIGSTNMRFILDCWGPNIDKYKGKNAKKWRRYVAAFKNSAEWWTSSIYRLFEKFECLKQEAIEKKGGRMISPNTPEFNLLVMDFFEQFENELYSWCDKRDGLKIFAKGLNYDQRYHLIRDVIKEGKWKYCIPIDAKNFDGHIVGKLAEAEIVFYTIIGLTKTIAEKLFKSRITGVVSYNYLTRKSGDMFTGCGNCFIMYSILFPLFKKLRIVCDGDDTLLFLNDEELYSEIVERFKLFGVELGPKETCVITEKKDKFEYDIPFCQMRYRWDDYELDHDRMLNKLCNIAVHNSPQAITEKIIGKLQACDVLRNMGYVFDLDPVPFFLNFDKSWWQEQKENYSKGTKYLNREMAHVVKFKSEQAGLVGKIVRELHKHKKEFTAIKKFEKRNKFVLRLMEDMIRKQQEIEESIDPATQQAIDKVNAWIDLNGVRAILPHYHDMVRRAVAKYYSIPIKEYPYISLGPNCKHIEQVKTDLALNDDVVDYADVEICPRDTTYDPIIKTVVPKMLEASNGYSIPDDEPLEEDDRISYSNNKTMVQVDDSILAAEQLTSGSPIIGRFDDYYTNKGTEAEDNTRSDKIVIDDSTPKIENPKFFSDDSSEADDESSYHPRSPTFSIHSSGSVNLEELGMPVVWNTEDTTQGVAYTTPQGRSSDEEGLGSYTFLAMPIFIDWVTDAKRCTSPLPIDPPDKNAMEIDETDEEARARVERIIEKYRHIMSRKYSMSRTIDDDPSAYIDWLCAEFDRLNLNSDEPKQ